MKESANKHNYTIILLVIACEAITIYSIWFWRYL